MTDALVQILEGNTFVVSDNRGDIEASLTDPTGLFSFDTRFLSRWVLTVNGQRLTTLSTDDMQYFQTRFFLVPGTGTVYVDSKLSVIREREVADGFREELRVLNHESEPVRLTIRIEAASDFADLFEVKDALAKKGSYAARVTGDSLVLRYERETYARETWISSSEPATLDEGGLSFAITVPPHGEWSTDLHVVASQGEPGTSADGPVGIRGQGQRRVRPDMARGLAKWLGRAPRLECDWKPMGQIYQRCLTDLAALRFSTLTMPNRSLPAAGLPWFMTIFGRDSILTSLQSLPFTSELAATTLLALAERQGTRTDDFRDEDPGRILHEMRYGEMTAFEERPHSPYYGNADATPLFVVLLDEYERWTGDTKLVRGLERAARAALAWIDDYADLQGNGYISYQRRNADTGSRTSAGRTPGIRSRTGTATYPGSRARPASCRATPTTPRCAAPGSPGWCGRTRPSRIGWRRRLRISSAASTVTSGYPDGEYFAVALDTDGRQVDSLTSNIGHLLWSGIVDKSKARAVARHLIEPAAVLRLGHPDAGRRRGQVQPDRVPRRNGLAVRQLVHRLGPAAVRVQGRGRGGGRGDHGRGRDLRRAAAGGVRRLPAQLHPLSGPVPDGLQPAGVVDRGAAAAAAGRPRAGARGRSPDRRPRAAGAGWAASSCWTCPAGGTGSTPSAGAGCGPTS